MKTLLLLGTLVCLLGHNSAGPLAPQLWLREGCCLTHKQTPIPQDKVKHVAMTPSDCNLKAVIITAVSGRKFCVDPDWIWAKKQLENFQKASNSSHSKP